MSTTFKPDPDKIAQDASDLSDDIQKFLEGYAENKGGGLDPRVVIHALGAGIGVVIAHQPESTQSDMHTLANMCITSVVLLHKISEAMTATVEIADEDDSTATMQ